MFTKEKYSEILNFISKNVFAFSLVLILAATTIGVSAAQILSPEGQKPFAFLNQAESASKQSSFNSVNSSESSKTRPLVADEDYEVLVIKECDLAVRFKKQIGEDIRKYEKVENDDEYDIVRSQELDRTIITIWPNIMPERPLGPEPRGIDIRCFEISDQNQINISLNNNFTLQKVRDKKEVCEDYFLTESFCEEVKIISEYEYSNYDPTIERAITFLTENKQYYIGSSLKSDLISDIQIQQNSLAPSEPSVEAKKVVNEMPESSSSIATQESSKSDSNQSQNPQQKTPQSSSSAQSSSAQPDYPENIVPVLAGYCDDYYGPRNDMCTLVDRDTNLRLYLFRDCRSGPAGAGCDEFQLREDFFPGRIIGKKYYFGGTIVDNMSTYLRIFEFNADNYDFRIVGEYEKVSIVPGAIYPPGESEAKYIEMNRIYDEAFYKYLGGL